MRDPSPSTDASSALIQAFDFARSKGCSRIALCYHDTSPYSRETIEALKHHGLTSLVRGTGNPAPQDAPVPILTPRDAAARGDLDGAVLGDGAHYDWLFREVEPLSLRGV